MNDNRKCARIMDIFFRLDKNEHLPIAATIHLLACKKCRSQVRLCTMAEKVCAKEAKGQTAVSENIVQAVMDKIAPQYLSGGGSFISLRKWIAAGIIMIAAMLAFGLSTSAYTDPSLMLAFYAIFGGIVTAYCALFIGSNLDLFAKKISSGNPIYKAIAGGKF